MRKVVIVSACRTAIGKYNGKFASTPTTELGSIVIKEAVRRTGFLTLKHKIDHVFMGCAIQANLGQNPARQAAIKAGLPFQTTATTINSVCGSGLDSVNLAAQMIQSGNADIVVAGGMENMSIPISSPYEKLSNILTDSFTSLSMICTVEKLGKKYNIAREEADEYALSSYYKYKEANMDKRFKDEIVPIGKVNIFDTDECPRDCSLEDLASLKCCSGVVNGTATAGNSSSIADGAAAIVMMSEERAKELHIKPMATFLGGCLGGLHPDDMGIGPVISTKKLLDKFNLSINDIDLIEINEAFATQIIAVSRELNLDIDKLNVNGGAIAMGHPIGSSGCRILVTLLHEMQRRDVKRGLASLCIGGGMGCSTIIEREDY